jgi:hypothetical protein
VPVTVEDDWSTWFWDRDVDGQANDAGETFSACPMHAPTSFVDPAAPRIQGQTSAGTITDCDDGDAAVFLGATVVDVRIRGDQPHVTALGHHPPATRDPRQQKPERSDECRRLGSAREPSVTARLRRGSPTHRTPP